MNKKGLLIVLFVFFLIITGNVYSSSKYSYDFTDPISIVNAASKMLMSGDYAEMSNITEGSEKKKTDDTIMALKDNYKLQDRLKVESEQIHSFEVTGMELYTNAQRIIIHTKWLIKVPARKSSPFQTSEDNKKGKLYSTVYVDYLLKQFDTKWKIISKQTK